MEKKSIFLITAFFFLVMISFVGTFYRYVLLRDFDVFTDETVFYESLEE